MFRERKRYKVTLFSRGKAVPLQSHLWFPLPAAPRTGDGYTAGLVSCTKMNPSWYLSISLPYSAYVTLVLAWLPSKRGMCWSWVQGWVNKIKSYEGSISLPLPLSALSCANVLVCVSPSDWTLLWGHGNYCSPSMQTKSAEDSAQEQCRQWDFWAPRLPCNDGLKISNWAESHAPGN